MTVAMTVAVPVIVAVAMIVAVPVIVIMRMAVTAFVPVLVFSTEVRDGMEEHITKKSTHCK